MKGSEECTYTWFGPFGTKRAEQAISPRTTKNMAKTGNIEPMVTEGSQGLACQRLLTRERDLPYLNTRSIMLVDVNSSIGNLLPGIQHSSQILSTVFRVLNH